MLNVRLQVGKEHDPLLTIAVFSGICAAGIAAGYYVLRLGMSQNDPLDVAKALLLSFVFIFFPPAYHLLRADSGTSTRHSWVSTNAGLSFLAFIAAICAGFCGSASGFFFLGLFCLTGAASAVITVFGFVRGAPVRTTIWFLGFCSIFSLWCIGSAYGSHYQSPLWVEALSVGRTHLDELLFTAVTNVIKTYQIPSTGLDGVPMLRYHWGSFWLFAQLSKLLQMNVAKFMNLAVPIVFIPLALNSMLTFALDVRRLGNTEPESPALRGDLPFWGLLAAAVIGFLPWASGHFAMTPLSIASVSYGVSFTLMFLMLSLGLSLIPTAQFTSTSVTAGTLVLSCVVLPGMLGFLVLTKLSTGFVVACIESYLFLRFRLYRRKIFVFSMLLSLLSAAIAGIYVTVPANLSGAQHAGFSPFHFLLNFVDAPSRPFFYVLHFFWSWLFVAAVLWGRRTRTLAESGMSLQGYHRALLEVAVVTSLVGAIPGLVMSIGVGNALWFSMIQVGLSITLLLAIIGDFRPFFRQIFDNAILLMKGRLGQERLKYVVVILVLLACAAGTTVKSRQRIGPHLILQCQYTTLPLSRQEGHRQSRIWL